MLRTLFILLLAAAPASAAPPSSADPSVFASGLDQPYGIAFFPPSERAEWVYTSVAQIRKRSEGRTGTTATSSSTSLSVTSLDVASPDPRRCSWSWAATIRNDRATATGDEVVVQAYQSHSGASRQPASGTSARAVRAGGTGTTNPITFHRLANVNQLEIDLRDSGRLLSKKVFGLPAEPPTRVDFSNALVRETNFAVDVVNLNATGLSDLAIQAHSGESPSGPWSPAGGRLVECIEGQGGFRKIGSKPQNHSHVRVVVSRGGAIVASRIFAQSDEGRPSLLERTPAILKK